MNKDKLKDLLMFYSSKKEKLVTLSEYVKEMQEGQNDIYYACGESYEKIAKLPQIEKATAKGYEILFFKDGVDEFVAKILMDFEGKKFKSVSEADFSLESDGEKKELEQKSEELKDLLGEMKTILGDKVKDVKLTAKLVSYPVCLTAVGDISIEMEKVFNSMPNADGKMKAEKVLEISSSHKILDTLKEIYATDKEKLKKYATVLYEQARLLEGLAIDNVTDFVSAISEII
jgi:molecular chaperone HtpG